MSKRLWVGPLCAIALIGTARANPYESGGKVDEFVGAYTESIPITVPPFHGIEPKLSFQYHSGRGSGLLGVGWSLQGFSVIEQTDGMYGPSEPTFEIDGQRLIQCKEHLEWTSVGPRSGACEYNEARTEAGVTTKTTWYSTLSESYLRLEHGIDLEDNQDTWVLWRTDGVRHHYKLAPGNTGRWLLQKVVDTSGNTVRYWWLGPVTNDTFNAPRAITYNGTIINFRYDSRTRAENFAEQGKLETMDKVLAIVDVCVDPDPTSTTSCDDKGNIEPRRARTYRLNYQTSDATSRPLLTAIRTFGKDAVVDKATVKSGTVAPQISITWKHPLPAYDAITTSPVWFWGTGNQASMVDFDGDGRADFCRNDGGSTTANIRCTFSRGAIGTEMYVGQINDMGDDKSGAWVDWNGDGRTDYCRVVLRHENGGPWIVNTPRSYRLMCAFSNGTGFTTDMQIGAPLPPDQQGHQNERWFTDWNGDGRADFCRPVDTGSGNSLSLQLRCAFSTGTSYTDKTVGAFKSFINTSSNVLPLDEVLGFPETRAMVDWNGDGRTDFCRVADEWEDFSLNGVAKTGRQVVKCLLGRAFELDRTKLPEFTSTESDHVMGEVVDRGSANTQWWVDVTGDGKTDYCRLIGSDVIRCAISVQRSLLDVQWSYAPSKFGAAETRRWGDIDGDGRMDMCFEAPGAVKKCVISNGLTGTETSLGITMQSTHLEGFSWMTDWDGDGRSEYCFNTGSAGGPGSMMTCIRRNAGSLFDLATAFHNGIGGKTSVAYTPATSFIGSSVKIPVVTSVTKEGGAEGPATQTFSYAGPQYDRWTRRFLGFAKVSITDPCIGWETICPSTEITSRLGWQWPTAPSRISRFADGREVNRVDYVYADTTSLPYRSELLDERHTIFDGSDVVTTQQTFAYDQYGNKTRIEDRGVVADTTGYFPNLAADDRTLETTYVANPNLYLANKPASIIGFDENGKKLTEAQYVYDFNNEFKDMPTRGMVTKTRVWLDTTGKYLESTAAYDIPGNLIRETDRNGNLTRYAIDETYRTFITRTTLPAAGTPAISQSISTTLKDWDARCGAKLRETHDQNQASTVTQLDALCRKVRTDYPGGGWERIEYKFSASGNSYTEVVRPNGIWQRTTFDGLGRVTKIENNGNIIEKEITYDRRGNVATMTRARYNQLGPIYGYTYEYDGQNRQTNAWSSPQIIDGKYHPGDKRATRYNAMTTIVRDNMGHAEMTVFDPRGRRILLGSTDGTTNPRDLTRYFYDRRGHLERIDQPAQQGTSTASARFATDSLGRRTLSWDSNAGGKTYTYDPNGNLETETDGTGTTYFTYDALNRRISKDSGRYVEWRFDEPRAGFANYGKLTSTEDPHGVATYDYDIAGNLVKGGRTVDGSKPYVFEKQYDIAGRLVETTYPDGSSVGPLSYDAAGRVSHIPNIIDEATYDASGQLTSYRAPSGAQATYDTTNPRGQIASYSFEGPATSGPLAIVGDYEASNTASATTQYREFELTPGIAAGQTITVTTCTSGVAIGASSGDTVLRLLVLPAGGSQKIEVASNDNSYVPGCGASSTITYRVDAAARVFVRGGCAGNTRCSATIGAYIQNEGTNVALGKTVAQSSFLDATCGPSASVVDGNPSGVWCSGSSMLHTMFQPQPWMLIDLGSDQDIQRIDVFNRTDCDAQCLSRLSNFEVSVAAANGAGGWQLVATNTDQAQWPTSLSLWKRARYVLLRLKGTNFLNTPEVRVMGPGPAGAYLASRPVFERVSIQRDLDGRVQRIDSTHARSSWTYGYSPDHTHELWEAENLGDPALSKSSSSDNGNVFFDNCAAIYGAGPGAQPHALYQNHIASFAYDGGGLLSYASNVGNVWWSRENHLVEYNGVSYAYDADGARLLKTVGYDTTIYLGDDYEISNRGNTKYISLGGKLVATQVGSDPATTLFTDHLGSVVLGLDGNGAFEFRKSYGPWGETIDGDDEGRGYTGQYKDENGLVYLHARYYDPQMGRFLSPDPTISSPSPIGMNGYAYALNDPINNTDINGLGPVEDWHANLTTAMGATSTFLSGMNLTTGINFIAKETGNSWRMPFDFKIGVGNSLAVWFEKFHAIGQSDYVAFGKAVASEAVITAAVVAVVVTQGGAAPLVAFIADAQLPFWLTLIRNGNFEEAWHARWDARFAQFSGPLFFAKAIWNQPANWLGRGTQALKNKVMGEVWMDDVGLGENLAPKPSVLSTLFDAGFVLIAADPYVAGRAHEQATSASSQSQLSSGSGTLFGYGYRKR